MPSTTDTGALSNGAGRRGVSVIPKLPPEDAELIDAARAASQEAVRAGERTSRLSQQVVELLRSEGMAVRDVGVLLGVSPQRVSQLVETGGKSLGVV